AMGTMIGFVLGYVLGTRAGEQGWEELLQSWRTISSSEEMKDLFAGGLSVARDALRQGAGMTAERLAQSERGSGLRVA
ncbi:MAG: hypothetical protein ACRDZY_14135, partial [Acidimicrobiales bacterium]